MTQAAQCDRSEEPVVLFREEQRFRQTWLWVLLMLLFFFPMLVNPIAEWARGNDGAPAIIGDRTGLVYMTMTFLVAAFFYVARLVTEVRKDGLYVRFFPIHLSFRRVPTKHAVAVKSVIYSPIRDYGGWGVRHWCGSKAYNMAGNRGVRIDYANGRHLLVGSQFPDMLAEAIYGMLPKPTTGELP